MVMSDFLLYCWRMKIVRFISRNVLIFFYLKCARICFAAEHRPDSLGSLQGSPNPLGVIRGWKRREGDIGKGENEKERDEMEKRRDGKGGGS